MTMADLLRDLDAVAALLDAPDNDLYAEATYKAARMIRTHHAEIAEAAADARRYRWLRETNGRHFPVSVAMKLGDATTGDEFDAVIDAAMRNSEQAEDRHD